MSENSEEKEKEQQQQNMMENIYRMQKNNRQSLTQVKRAKKQIEEDTKILANRIALLKQEEIKTIKKIEDTKKKAFQIFKTKQKNEQKLRERADQEEELMRKKEEQRKQRELSQMEKENKRQVWQQVKIDHYEQIKQMQQHNRSKKQQYLKDQLDSIHSKSQLIKQSRIQARQKIQSFQTQKRIMIQQEYAKEFEQEDKKRKKQLKQIAQMEKLEQELIQKLQHTQNIQKQAYSELEDAINLDPKVFEDKFINQNNFKLQTNEQSNSSKNLDFTLPRIENNNV